MKKLKIAWKILLIISIVFVGIYGSIYLVASITPKLNITDSNSYYIYDSEDNLINSTTDKWIKLDEVSENLINATIAIEDKNFYSHDGFDYLRILKSMYVNVTNGKTLQGASTITQQFVKNLYLDFDKTWQRKLKEAWLTVRMETQYSKDEILEGYLNTINYGGVYGVENASYYYFNKSASELSIAEASMIAGIPKSPSNYSPLNNLKNAKERQALVLDAMLKNNYITEEEKEIALNTELQFYGYLESNKNATLMYYQDAVMKELETIEGIPTTLLETGGLKIYTYLDMNAQNILDQSIKDNFNNEEMQLSAVMMNPLDGSVIALAGGTDYNKSQYNRAISSKRQVGSTIKPFLYYSALENGFTASTTFTSEETTFVFSNDQTYSPSNYNDKYGNKNISMAAALAYSDNIYAVKTHLFLGEESLVNISKRVGITSKLESIPSLALGSEEINILEMMQAYSSLANEGYKVKSHFISKIEDMDGNILYEYKLEEDQVLNSSLVYILNELLTSTYNYNFIDYNYPTCYDITNKLTHKYSLKTGTTDTDHLIFGYNKNIVLGLWNGYDDNRMLEKGDTRAINIIWADVMEKYLSNKEELWYDIPSNVVGVLVDPISGEAANNNTKSPTMFYYIKGTEPTYTENNLDNLIPTIKQQ